MSRMKYFFLTLVACCQAVSVLAAFSIGCGSTFTVSGTSFCVGIPVECEVSLDSDLCIAGVDTFSKSELTMTLVNSSTGTASSPSYSLTQSGLLLTLVTEYVPETQSVVTVTVAGNSASNANCTFSVSHIGSVERASSTCNYPVSLELGYLDSTCSEVVSGGDLIPVNLELISPLLQLPDFRLTLISSHPALLLIDFTFILDEQIANSGSSGTVLLGDTTVPENETLSGNITFRVMPYVLPQATLYFSLHVQYIVPSHGAGTFRQRFDFDDCVSSNITHGNISFRLHNYAEDDHVNNTFPPHADDLFSVMIPVRVPCVSTDLSLTLMLPEFISDNFTRFFVNLSSIEVDLPLNMLYVTQLCQYQDIDNFDYTSCDFDSFEVNTNMPFLTESEMEGPGVDEIHIVLGPLWYNLTNIENCSLELPSSDNCTCLEQEVIISLSGHVVSDTCEYLPNEVVCNNESVCQCPSRSILNPYYIETNLTFCDLPCENQTLADNITCEIEHTVEETVPVSPTSITYVGWYEYEFFEVNASMPAISIPINSYTGDAGDVFNLTCGYLHDAEYSSFTTYDLNYTFSADFHLDPEYNITICFFNSSSGDEPAFCEDRPFINNTITREGFHPIFKLFTDKIELTVEVTIIQDVAPAESFSNPGDAIFRSLPCNNTFDLFPITCTNSSSGSVTIFPVILKPWVIHYSDVEATVTESPANPSYVTIGERFNMTILAFMPECWTGLHLYVTLPNQGSGSPLVTLNDAYVTFIGSELLNTTLMEGDNITSGNNITVNDEIVIDFFFGPRVLVPATPDNTREVNNQSFEIGLDCTVKDHSSLVNNVAITFSAYVETDNEVRTQVESISPRIAEPYLDFFPVDPSGPLDAGDEVPWGVTTEHDSSTQQTSAFRFNFTFEYLTEFMFLDGSDAIFEFSVNDVLVDDFTPSAIVSGGMGMVPYRLDEKGVDDSVLTLLGLTLTNNVVSRSDYTVYFTAVWHSLPPGYEGGRSYSDDGEIQFTIDDLQIGMTFTTSNPLTPDDDLQFQEQVSVNITITFPEGFSELLLLVSHVNYALGDHSFNITQGKVIHVGENIKNLTLFVNDTRDTSPFITSSDITDITFDCGSVIRNLYDNSEDEKDELIFNILGFVSNDGTSFSEQQRIRLEAEDQIYTDRDDREHFFLSHPVVQVTSVATNTFGLVDGGDAFYITVQVDHQASAGFVSYNICLDLSVEGPEDSVLNLTLLRSSSVTEENCFEGGPINFMKSGLSSIHIPYLLDGCGASLELKTTVPDSEAFAGSNFVFHSYISEYFAIAEGDEFVVVPRWTYGPSNLILATIYLDFPTHSIRFLNDSTFIAPQDTLAVEHVITFPEGHILNVSAEYRVVIQPPGNVTLEDNFVINDPYSSVIFNTTSISVLPSSLGDLNNVFDNKNSISDEATFSFTTVAPANAAGYGFLVSVSLTFNDTVELVDISDVQTEVAYVVLPTIETETGVSHTVVQVKDNITSRLNVSRTDSTHPTYDILSVAVLFLPLESILDPAFDPEAIISVEPLLNGSAVTLNLTRLSYVPDNSSTFLEFDGTIGSLAPSQPFIQLYGFVEYQSAPSNGHLYMQPVIFPKVFVVEADLTFKLLSTSLDLTADNSLVVDEEAVLRATLSNVSGPSSDLLLLFSLKESTYVEFVDTRVLSVGMALDYADVEVMTEQDEALVTFVNLSRVVFDSDEEGCLDCTIVADVYLRTVRDEQTTQLNVINASAAYSLNLLNIQMGTGVVVTPLTKLLAAIFGPSMAIENGGVFEINVTVFHEPIKNVTRNAYNLVLELEYPKEYVLAPATFSYMFSDGTSGVFNFEEIEAGLNISVLPHNETLLLMFQFQLDPNVTVQDLLVFGVAAQFSNLKGSDIVEAIQASFIDFTSTLGVYIPENFVNLTVQVEDTSSGFTTGNRLAINEVFQILLKVPVPLGERDIRVVAEVQVLGSAAVLPVQVLNTNQSIPTSLSTEFSGVSIVQAASVLEITWDFGSVNNPVNGSNDTAAVMELTYTGVILDADIASTTLLFLATPFTDDVMLLTAVLSADTLVPQLILTKTISEIPRSDPLEFQVTVLVSHDVNSTGPAFLVKIHERVPEILDVVTPFFLDDDGTQTLLHDFDTLDNTTLLLAEIEVMPVEAEINFTYYALLRSDHQTDGEFVAPTVVDYTTIRQEGIGLEYDTLFAGRSLNFNSTLCINKIVDITIIELKFIEKVVVPLFVGFFFILLIILIIVIVYYCIKKLKPKNMTKIAPAALVAAVIGMKEKEEDYLMFKNKRRPLFSSLLDALPKRTWNERDDVHECREADYIAEAEGSLLYAKGEMIVHLFDYFLQSKTSLTQEKIKQKSELFEVKVNILQKTLQESIRSELEDAALQHGANKILEEEEQDSKHQEAYESMRNAIPMNMSVTTEILEHIQEQNQQEKMNALDLIEMISKRDKLKSIKHYTSHYLLGLKAIVINILRDASPVYNKDEIISDLYGAMEYGEKLIERENNELIEMANTRGKRQKTVLLDKKLVEEADQRWRILILNQISRSIAGLIKFGVLQTDNRDFVLKKLEEALLDEFDWESTIRWQHETKLNNGAKVELRRLALQLSKPSQIQYYSDDTEMLETEFQKWHNKQVKREDALKLVEDKLHKELIKSWEDWQKRRYKITINFAASLTSQLLARGLELEQCDSIMQEHSKCRLEVNEAIETSRLVQMAKFRAKLNYLEERLLALVEQSEKIFKMKLEVERKYLDKVKQTIGKTSVEESNILEEYHSDIKKLEKSLSVEKLSIHIDLKEKIALRRSNKFEALNRQYLRRSEEERDEECLRAFLDKRRDVVFEIWTRSYEEERRKAEEEYTQKKERLLNMSETVSSFTKSRSKTQTGVSNQVVPFSEPLEIQDETVTLLSSHQDNLTKLSSKLEDQRKKAILDLEWKMKKRRLQREQTLAQLIQPEWSPFKRPRFKELVQKLILSKRVENIRTQHMENLTEALETLQKDFTTKKQEAKEKLEKRLETHLIKVGKVSSDKLVEIFEEMHYAADTLGLKPVRRGSLEPLNPLKRPMLRADDPLGIKRGSLEPLQTTGSIGRARVASDSVDPLLMNRPKQGELPPISTYLSRRGSL